MEPNSSRPWIFLWIDILKLSSFFSSWTFLTQLRVPPAPLAFLIQFLSPVYEEFLDSAIFNVKIKYPSLNKFFEPCVANWQTFQCWHVPLLFSSNPFNGQTSYIFTWVASEKPSIMIFFLANIIICLAFNLVPGDLLPLYLSPSLWRPSSPVYLSWWSFLCQYMW